jgi:hypothetical protein
MVRWAASLFVVGCRFGNAVPVNTDATPDDTPVDSDGSRLCPNGFTASGSHCFVFNNANNAWSSARIGCQTVQADLAWPPDAMTLQAMTDLAGGGHDYWVGISDAMTPGVYMTVSGQMATYLPWGLGEPKMTGACVRVHKQGGGPTFMADRCDVTLPAVCDLPAM